MNEDSLTSGGPPSPVDAPPGLPFDRVRGAWAWLTNIATAPGLAALLTFVCTMVAIIVKMSLFLNDLDHRLTDMNRRFDGLATTAQLEKTRDAILNRLDTHDEILTDIAVVLESAKPGVFAIPVNRARMEARLSLAREKTQPSIVWNHRQILKPFEGPARRQGQAVVMLASSDSTAVAAGAGGVIHLTPGGGVEIAMREKEPGAAVARMSAGWPAPLQAALAPDARAPAESLFYRGLSKVAVTEGQSVSRGQIIGELIRAERSPMVAMKLSVEYRMAGVATEPPAQLPVLNLGQEVFEFKCAACHSSSPGAMGPSLTQLRASNLTAEQFAAKLGDGGLHMPSFEGALSPEEKKALTDFLLLNDTPSGASVVARRLP